MNSSSNALRREDAGEVAEVRLVTPSTQPPALPDETAVAVQVWDPALRTFHWLLATAIGIAVISGEVGGPWIEWHARAGEAIAGLLAFRLVWGVIGPRTARFASFVRGPRAIARYLRGEWQGIGHNPLGALAVLALLLLGVLQAGSGLFANDDIAFQGPLAALVSGLWSDRASGLHQKLSWLLIGMVCLHLLAIAWYRMARKHDLIGPMLHGRREVAPRQLALLAAGPSAATVAVRLSPLRLAVAAGFGALTMALVSGQWLPSGGSPSHKPSAPAVQASAPARPAW